MPVIELAAARQDRTFLLGLAALQYFHGMGLQWQIYLMFVEDLALTFPSHWQAKRPCCLQ